MNRDEPSLAALLVYTSSSDGDRIAVGHALVVFTDSGRARTP